ncbi:MAG: hypothetical protein AAFN81_13290 [Bacteroidota bacterium]
MHVSRLSLRRVNNIERQIALHRDEIVEVVKQDDGAAFLQFKTGERSAELRDFFEFYLDDQPLISIIGNFYWDGTTTIDSAFFNSKVGCLGSFGRFWDEVYIKILLQQELTEKQCQSLLTMFEPNFVNEQDALAEQGIRNLIIKNMIDDFLFYRCQACGDGACGGITLNIVRTADKITWTDNEKIKIHFDFNQYKEVLLRYLKENYNGK